MLSIIFFMIVNLLPERRWRNSLPRWTGISMGGSALRSSWARCRWSNYHDYFKHRKNFKHRNYYKYRKSNFYHKYQRTTTCRYILCFWLNFRVFVLQPFHFFWDSNCSLVTFSEYAIFPSFEFVQSCNVLIFWTFSLPTVHHHHLTSKIIRNKNKKRDPCNIFYCELNVQISGKHYWETLQEHGQKWRWGCD